MNNQGWRCSAKSGSTMRGAVLKKAAKLSPDDPFVQNNFGRRPRRTWPGGGARPHHEQALRGLPGDARLLAHYGICLAALGERDRARETLDARARGRSEQRGSPARPRRPRRMSDGADHPAEVSGHIAEAARAAGRSPADVTLVAVSKTHGAERVRELLEVGHRVFGENRVQEAEQVPRS